MIRSFRGISPKIADSAFISEAAYVVGDVEIGENSSVWPGTVIRGDFGKIRIGRNNAIEDNTVIHAGTPNAPTGDLSIGDNVHIGHGAVINGKSIGDNVLIGMNATILHEAVIGSFCIIGAGCLVSDGMQVPDRSFVAGVPAMIKGEVSQKQLWWVEKAPELYREMAEEYLKEGL
jgi:carbonic anhydrase/acetyltransferase-like protein (isoleucine patch superfamily)